MNDELATTGFTGGDAATGPTAGYDPVMRMRAKRKALKGLVAPGNKLKAGGKTVKESKVDRYAPKSHLFQYKVSLPEVGETIVYANNPAELRMKLRLLINYRYRGDIKIERIMPGNAAKFFMDKRMNHMKNVKEGKEKGLDGKACWDGYSLKGTKKKGGKTVDNCVKNVKEQTDEKQMQNQITRQKHTLEKKKANLKIQTIRKQLQKKTQQLKAKGRVGGNTQDYN
jgi:hypothetical protein